MVVEDLQVPVPKKKPGPDGKLDDFDADLVKRTIHDMQLKGQYVSLRQLSDVLVKKGVRLTKSSLGRLVKDLVFRFYKAGSNQHYIGDRNIVSMRHTYLRSIRKFREEGRPIVYLDETWLNTNHVARGDLVDCPRTSTSAFESHHRGGHNVLSHLGKALV
uniref:Tc1-like transposase DDE domain-containing protein n=1 Tax=Magallana gigas TaxID=29159 RepID=K1QF09_MAGGI